MKKFILAFLFLVMSNSSHATEAPLRMASHTCDGKVKIVDQGSEHDGPILYIEESTGKEIARCQMASCTLGGEKEKRVGYLSEAEICKKFLPPIPAKLVKKYGEPKIYSTLCEGKILVLDYNYNPSGPIYMKDFNGEGEGPLYYIKAVDNSELTVCGKGCNRGGQVKCNKGENCQCDEYCRREVDICDLVKGK